MQTHKQRQSWFTVIHSQAFWLALCFPSKLLMQNTRIWKQSEGQWVGMSYPAVLWYYVNLIWFLHSQCRVCYCSSDGAQSQNYQIAPLGREWRDSTSCLLIATFHFLAPNTTQEASSPVPPLIVLRSIISWFRKFAKPLIKSYRSFHWIDPWCWSLRPGGREAELQQRWETNWLWVKSLAQIMTPLVQH